VRADSLLIETTDHAERVCHIDSCPINYGDWLNALPVASVGLMMDNSTEYIAIGLSLGAPIFSLCAVSVARQSQSMGTTPVLRLLRLTSHFRMTDRQVITV